MMNLRPEFLWRDSNRIGLNRARESRMVSLMDRSGTDGSLASGPLGFVRVSARYGLLHLVAAPCSSQVSVLRTRKPRVSALAALRTTGTKLPFGAADGGEERGLTKGNSDWQNAHRTQRRGSALSALDRVRQASCGSASHPEVGAQRGSSARWDLCGGPRVTGVPTATSHPNLPVTSGPDCRSSGHWQSFPHGRAGRP